MLPLVYELLETRAEEILQRQRAEDADEAQRYNVAEKVRALRAPYFGRQRRLWQSSRRKRVGFCTRRAGKSMSGLRELCARALEIENSRHFYFNTTFAECEAIAWVGNRRDGLVALNEDYELGAKENHTKLRLTFSNGSIVQCYWADDQRAIKKALGTAPDTVWLDEAQKMIWIQQLLEDVVGPALLDHQGHVIMTGTPDIEPVGLFHELTEELTRGDVIERRGWELHCWSILDNPHFGATEEERLEVVRAEMRENGWEPDHPSFLRSYGPKWVKEDMAFVYDLHRVPEEKRYYAPARMTEDGLPDVAAALADLPKRTDGRERRWRFSMAVDLGYHPDPFASCVLAWADDEDTLYELFSWKRTEMLPDEQAEWIRGVLGQVGVTILVGDAGGLGAATLAGWNDRYALPIEAAMKREKATHQELVNNDLRTDRLKLRRGGDLADEMEHLVWRPRKTLEAKPEEWKHRRVGRRVPGNDCCDAALYAHRHARHYLAKDLPDAPPKQGTSAYWEKLERELEEAVYDDGGDDDPLEELFE